MAKVQSDKSVATRKRERERRTRSLYLHNGYRPPEICDVLREEGLLLGLNRSSALRLIQEQVKSIREEAEPEAILALQIPAETERYRQRLLKAAREQLAIIESDESADRQVVTPKGNVVTVQEPRWPASVKQKAIKDYAAISEKLARLDGVDVAGGGIGSQKPPEEDGKPVQTSPFEFVMTGQSMDTLITLNVEQGKVN